MTRVLDGGWRTTRDAEHDVRETLAVVEVRPRLACTHFVTGRVVVTLDAAGDVELPQEVESLAAGGGLAEAVGAHRSRSAGRVFLFDGDDALPDRLSIAELLSGTAIEEVRGVGGADVPRDSALLTQGFVRPSFADGRMVLRVRPAAGDVVVPFEQPNPTPCCADHP